MPLSDAAVAAPTTIGGRGGSVGVDVRPAATLTVRQRSAV